MSVVSAASDESGCTFLQGSYHFTFLKLLKLNMPRSFGSMFTHFCSLSVRVAAVIYCAALDEFDMVCPEEPTKNKMEESLEVFEKVRSAAQRSSKSFFAHPQFRNKTRLSMETSSKISLSFCSSTSGIYLKRKWKRWTLAPFYPTTTLVTIMTKQLPLSRICICPSTFIF